jgi:hypothetical protein
VSTRGISATTGTAREANSRSARSLGPRRQLQNAVLVNLDSEHDACCCFRDRVVEGLPEHDVAVFCAVSVRVDASAFPADGELVYRHALRVRPVRWPAQTGRVRIWRLSSATHPEHSRNVAPPYVPTRQHRSEGISPRGASPNPPHRPLGPPRFSGYQSLRQRRPYCLKSRSACPPSPPALDRSAAPSAAPRRVWAIGRMTKGRTAPPWREQVLRPRTSLRRGQSTRRSAWLRPGRRARRWRRPSGRTGACAAFRPGRGNGRARRSCRSPGSSAGCSPRFPIRHGLGALGVHLHRG